MKLQVKQVVRYSLQTACTCPRATTGDCGISYRNGNS